MFHRSLRLPGLLLALMAAHFVPSASAAVITTGCGATPTSCTFQQLVQGGTIQAGDLVFSGFQPFANHGTTTQPPNPLAIVVTGLDDGGFNPGPGLRFDLNGEFDVVSPFAIDVVSAFLVGPASSTSLLIEDSSLELLFGSANGSGALSGVEQALLDTGACTPAPPAPCTHSLDYVGNGVSMTMSHFFFGPQASVSNSLILRVFPAMGNATLNSFEVRFSQQAPPDPPNVPEPGALSMMAAGLLALAAIVRKRRAV